MVVKMTAKRLVFIWLFLRLVSFAPLIPEAEGLEELVFDLTTLNKDDYVIKWADGEEKSYEFKPKPDRIIDEVKFRGVYAWKRHADFQVESVIIHYVNADSLRYALNIVDGKMSKQSLHFNSLGDSYWKQGIIEYNHNIHSFMFHDAKPYYRFDLTSNFDKTFYLNVQKGGNGLEVFVFESSFSFSFDDVVDGEELLYSNSKDKVDRIHFTTKNDAKFLLNLTTKNYRDYYFISSEGKWAVLEEKEYKRLYDEHKLLFLDIKFKTSTVDRVVDLSLTTAKYFNTQDEHLITVPAIKYSLNVLKEVREGPDAILLGDYKEADLIAYRGNYSFDMIEITHNLGAEYIRKYYENFTGKLKGKNALRGLNYYYIKNNGEWINVDQVTFFRRFKVLLVANLQQANKTASPADVQKNLVLIDKLKALEAFDTTKRYLTEEINFTKPPELLETPDPDPTQKPWPTPTHYPKPAWKPTRPFYKRPSPSTHGDDPGTPKPDSPGGSQGSDTDGPVEDDPYKVPYDEAEAMLNRANIKLNNTRKANLKKKSGSIKKESVFYACSGSFILAYFLI